MANEKRLIDANELQRRLAELGAEPNYQHPGEDWGVGVSMADTIVDEMPTVDAVEVVHGRWINEDWGDWRCSACRKLYSFDDFGDIHPLGDCGYNYCPNCGAKMDGERREGE